MVWGSASSYSNEGEMVGMGNICGWNINSIDKEKRLNLTLKFRTNEQPAGTI